MLREKIGRLWEVIGRSRRLSALVCAVIGGGMFYLVNHPAVVGTSATTRQLPIYCVQRDQKMAALTFDAAWGDVILRQFNCKEERL